LGVLTCTEKCKLITATKLKSVKVTCTKPVVTSAKQYKTAQQLDQIISKNCQAANVENTTVSDISFPPGAELVCVDKKFQH